MRAEPKNNRTTGIDTVAIGNPAQHVRKASHLVRAHPVRGESHNQRNATGEVATILTTELCSRCH